MKRVLIACALSGVALAQSNTPAPPQSADWTGFYRIVRGKDLGNLKPINPNLDDVIVAHLQPWARLKMDATDGVADDTGQICQADGIFRFPLNGGTFFWAPASDRVVIVHGEINTAGVQRIYLNRQHPRNLLPTWNGDSVGHWEGDTLVADTIGFNDKSWLQSTMVPHTEEAHLIQRFRQVGNGAFIEITFTVEDRHTLTSAYTYSRYYKKVRDDMEEQVCNDDLQIWRDWRNKALKRQLDRAREVR